MKSAISPQETMAVFCTYGKQRQRARRMRFVCSRYVCALYYKRDLENPAKHLFKVQAHTSIVNCIDGERHAAAYAQRVVRISCLCGALCVRTTTHLASHRCTPDVSLGHGTGCGGLNIGGGAPELVTGSRDGMTSFTRRFSSRVDYHTRWILSV